MQTLNFCITPPAEFVLPYHVSEEVFRTAMAIFALGMALNVCSIAWMLARWSTAALNRSLQRAASAVLGLSLSLVHPEMLTFVADRRVDVFALRKLGAMTACCMDLPLLIVFSANMDWSWRNRVATATCSWRSSSSSPASSPSTLRAGSSRWRSARSARRASGDPSARAARRHLDPVGVDPARALRRAHRRL